MRIAETNPHDWRPRFHQRRQRMRTSIRNSDTVRLPRSHAPIQRRQHEIRRLRAFNSLLHVLLRRSFVEYNGLDERSTEQDVQKAIERAKSADLVLASLYGRVRSGQADSVGIPDAGAHALAALMKARTPIVGISFGNPYLLQTIPLRTYLVAYGDMPSLQQAVARALVGEIGVVGKLPISLPGLYPRATGIQIAKSK